MGDKIKKNEMVFLEYFQVRGYAIIRLSHNFLTEQIISHKHISQMKPGDQKFGTLFIIFIFLN